jgi:hypothetical protein
MCSILLIIDRCLAKILKKNEKPYRYRGIKKADNENRTDLEKIPSEIPKTDTELKNRHRPKSSRNG